MSGIVALESAAYERHGTNTRGRARSAGHRLATLAVLAAAACSARDPTGDGVGEELDPALVADGREIFRHDTYGNEVFWGDTLRLHEVIAQAVDPGTALAVGLRVDADALPPGVLETADLSDPATTVALLRLDAVVGVEGTFDEDGTLTHVGITCALCHSTVDNSVRPGVGRRLDGWPNRDLDVGAIVALSPVLDSATKAVFDLWGAGMYDARFNIDGLNDPTVIPPAYGLRSVDLETYTGEGGVSYWNAYVAVTQMHGRGSFSDPRLGIDITASPDLVTPKLGALLEYQRSLEAPVPPAGSFDPAAAERGRIVFEGDAGCVACHVPPTFTDDEALHAPSETGMDPLHAQRSTTKRYRTTPLAGAWQHPPYFHDGSAASLRDVVDHYDAFFGLGLNESQKDDLVEYLKSL